MLISETLLEVGSYPAVDFRGGRDGIRLGYSAEIAGGMYETGKYNALLEK